MVFMTEMVYPGQSHMHTCVCVCVCVCVCHHHHHRRHHHHTTVSGIMWAVRYRHVLVDWILPGIVSHRTTMWVCLQWPAHLMSHVLLSPSPPPICQGLFLDAMKLVGSEFRQCILDQLKISLPAKNVVKTCLDNRFEVPSQSITNVNFSSSSSLSGSQQWWGNVTQSTLPMDATLVWTRVTVVHFSCYQVCDISWGSWVY